MLNIKEKEVFDKAVKRMANMKITDPTNIIIKLQEEIDDYRKQIEMNHKDVKKREKEEYLKNAFGETIYNCCRIVNEDKDYIYVESGYGTYKYSKLELAKFWLTHSNDCFYKTFGFSWVPDSQIESIARAIINKKNSDECKAKQREIKIGIDFADALSYSMQSNYIDFKKNKEGFNMSFKYLLLAILKNNNIESYYAEDKDKISKVL